MTVGELQQFGSTIGMLIIFSQILNKYTFTSDQHKLFSVRPTILSSLKMMIIGTFGHNESITDISSNVQQVCEMTNSINRCFVKRELLTL